MGTKKFIVTLIMPFICVAFISSQSLVEVAKKEKERRAKIKNKSTKVVTNADLKKGTKSPSVTVPPDQVVESEEAKPESKTSPQEKPENLQPKEDDVNDEPANLAHLEQKYEHAQERVELLLQKMNDLWQKYNNPGDMIPKDRVQSEIARTYLMLQKAQQDAAEIKKDWDEAISKQDK